MLELSRVGCELVEGGFPKLDRAKTDHELARRCRGEHRLHRDLGFTGQILEGDDYRKSLGILGVTVRVVVVHDSLAAHDLSVGNSIGKQRAVWACHRKAPSAADP
ncbi:MAG: hypothetical protein U0165_10655 [Polyangiaceae bacterium]